MELDQRDDHHDQEEHHSLCLADALPLSTGAAIEGVVDVQVGAGTKESDKTEKKVEVDLGKAQSSEEKNAESESELSSDEKQEDNEDEEKSGEEKISEETDSSDEKQEEKE